ncbi:hypothetical protein ABZX92_31530 [Lentzea sp. NPDC006480]|uniref:hypothetical protein n=1 Tax=Lentzea sp. NPDC006480 TaxID=3157176 RepID=UPI0033B1744D
MTDAMTLAKAIADAVLYEGYLLYPYRASAAKNQLRWQWGVLMPPSFTRGGEHPDSRAELLMVPSAGATLHVRLRFLHLQSRVVEVPDGAGHRAVPSATVAGHEHTTWDEAVEREIDLEVGVADLVGRGARRPFEVDGGSEVEMIAGGGGARLVRTRWTLWGELRMRADPVPGRPEALRLRVWVRNTSPWTAASSRQDALKRALISAHTLLAVSGGSFLSLVNPPEWAAEAVRGCRNERTWPVLVGDQGRDDAVLCAPIILYDHPKVAEQSHGEMFDATEIDELLTLRTMTLTPEEKRQVRATDARAAALLDRVDGLPAESVERLHGAMRRDDPVEGMRGKEPVDRTHGARRRDSAQSSLGVVRGEDPAERLHDAARGEDPAQSSPDTARGEAPPDEAPVLVDGVLVGKGSRVRLRPVRKADAHDMFLAGRTAVVHRVMSDVDGGIHLAVTLEDDLGADLLAASGLYRYFGPEEVDPL